MDKKRRDVLGKLVLAPALLGAHNLMAYPKTKPLAATRVQYSLNAYSFNSMLRSGEMTFFDMMEFAADIGLNAVDLTTYYFPSYPEIPSNSELFDMKRKALELGLDIPWTGVRSDFVNPDVNARKADQEMLRNWLAVSSKLGASIIRIFTGRLSNQEYARDEVKEWLVDEFKTCAKYGEEAGVIVALQNHHEFLFTSDEVIDILKQVDSHWFGLILDIGSLRTGNTYEEIEKLAPYANYWFVKEYVYPDGNKTPVDMRKIATIIKNQGYRGYISFESLSDGDPKQIITTMLNSFKAEYQSI